MENRKRNTDGVARSKRGARRRVGGIAWKVIIAFSAVLALAIVVNVFYPVFRNLPAAGGGTVAASFSTTSTTEMEPGVAAMPGTATTTTAPTTTTTTVVTEQTPRSYDFDVVVVGESGGAVCAALASAEGGMSVALLSDVGYLGGQSSAAGVSTMDDAGPRDLLQGSGCYMRLMEELKEHYGEAAFGPCYFSSDTVCPEPSVVRDIFEHWMDSAGVTIIDGLSVDSVVQKDNVVIGVEDTDSNVVVFGRVVIDGTEFSDLYPLIDGLEYSVGYPEQSCAQKTTWSTVRNYYSDGVPDELVVPEDAIDDLASLYGEDVVEGWLSTFRRVVGVDGEENVISEFPGWGRWSSGEFAGKRWSSGVEHGYRALADSREEILALLDDKPAITRSGLNNNAVDSLTTPSGIDDPGLRHDELQLALHRMYAYLWYERYELGVLDWGIADDLGYDDAVRLFWDEPNIIPDEIEQHMPPIPYTREGRRLEGSTLQTLTWETLVERDVDHFADSVMIGGYMADSHGCGGPDELRSGYGVYDVPIGIFVPADVDGFLPGIVRAAGVDRVAASSLRMQPTEMLGGEVAGVIAALAVERGVQPRDVPAESVRQELLDRGAVVDAQ